MEYRKRRFVLYCFTVVPSMYLFFFLAGCFAFWIDGDAINWSLMLRVVMPVSAIVTPLLIFALLAMATCDDEIRKLQEE